MNKASACEKGALFQKSVPSRNVEGTRSSVASSQQSANQIYKEQQEPTQIPSLMSINLCEQPGLARGEQSNLPPRLANLWSQQHSQMQSPNPVLDPFAWQQQAGRHGLAGASNVQSATFGSTGISHHPPINPTDNPMMQIESHRSTPGQPNICQSTTQLQWSHPLQNQPIRPPLTKRQ